MDDRGLERPDDSGLRRGTESGIVHTWTSY
jgi:hypothetical protein